MPIAKTIEAPEWVDSGSLPTDGLDLLGLRLPVQTIGGSLLDGVTTVTPSVRYIAIRAWLIYRYGESHFPDSWQQFTEFSAYAECALVLANLIENRTMKGLIGADEGVIRLDAHASQIGISSLVKTPASTVYAGPSQQLRVSWSRDEKVPGIYAERGRPLALAVDKTLSGIPLVTRLFEGKRPDSASRDELAELGKCARIDQIPDTEREALIAALLPEIPLSKEERTRIGTYAALLTLAKGKGAPPTERDLFSAACSPSRFSEPLLDLSADGWLTYCVRDAIAASQEAVLAAVMNEVVAGPEGGQSGVERFRVVAELLERVDEHNAPLRNLGLIEASESVADLTFRQLVARVEAKVSAGQHEERGISRWSSGLTEPTLYNLALSSGAGALSLAVVTWIVAAIRVGTGVRENLLDFGNLSYQGWRRLGLREVILPEIERLLREDPPFRNVAADFAYRAVQQHLQIAWSRLQVDLRRDVALITSEGNRWFSRGKTYRAGRTASRLQQALGWMTQLKLIDANGATADGENALAGALQVLSKGESA
jgi:hypothetical protein